MPYFPTLNETKVSRLFTDKFTGYNHALSIPDGQFYDTFNMSADDYPLAVTRKKRGKDSSSFTEEYGFTSKNGSNYIVFPVSETEYRISRNGYTVSNLQGQEMCIYSANQRFVHIGAYLVLFPAKVWINTAQYTETANYKVKMECGNLESTVECTQADFLVLPKDGSAFEWSVNNVNGEIGDTTPDNPYDGMKWLDTSATSPMLKRYSESSGMWIQCETVIRIVMNTSNVNNMFSVGDGITISGITESQAAFLNAIHTVREVGNNYISVDGIMSPPLVSQINSTITISRTVPEMDFVIEAGNRLWGCKSGVVDGKTLNEIYCSKLGDFKNWNCFSGISTDSWVSGVGSDGEFTGAVTYAGSPMFFKENCFHKVQMSSSGAHQIVTTNCRGVQKGSGASLAVVDGVLYYKAVSGVCAYTGSLPESVSEALGKQRYDMASAGALESKYYISMRQYVESGNTIESGSYANGQWLWTERQSTGEYVYSMFVYDTANGIWYKEDDTQAIRFTNIDNDLFFQKVSTVGDNTLYDLYTVNGSILSRAENKIGWYLRTGNFGYSYPDKKYLSRFDIRMSLEQAATAEMFIEYDSSGTWESQGTVTGTGNPASFLYPLIPRRCDHMRIQLRGTGACKIYSIAKNLETGSDM